MATLYSLTSKQLRSRRQLRYERPAAYMDRLGLLYKHFGKLLKSFAVDKQLLQLVQRHSLQLWEGCWCCRRLAWRSVQRRCCKYRLFLATSLDISRQVCTWIALLAGGRAAVLGTFCNGGQWMGFLNYRCDEFDLNLYMGWESAKIPGMSQQALDLSKYLAKNTSQC